MMRSAATARVTPSPRLVPRRGARSTSVNDNRRVLVVAKAADASCAAVAGEGKNDDKKKADADDGVVRASRGSNGDDVRGGRRGVLGGAGAIGASFFASCLVELGPATPAAVALYNKDLDVPITDPVQAVATVFGGGRRTHTSEMRHPILSDCRTLHV